jgi:VWFA-related protein
MSLDRFPSYINRALESGQAKTAGGRLNANDMRTVIVAAGLLALAALRQSSGQAPQPQREVIRRSVTYVTTDVSVRNEQGQFVATLGRGDFDVYEDSVKQEIVTFVLTHGGLVLSVSGPRAATQEGLLVPPARPTNDSSGRIFLIFLDDANITFRETSAVRDLLKKISTELVHDGDLFGIVSTGTSSIAVDMTYDRKRLDEAISKISGNGLTPSEIIGTPDGSQGPPEVRHRAHVAFSTAYDVLQKLEQVHNRRKAFIYISSGYDFDPFAKSRSKASSRDSGQVPETNPFSRTGNEFAAADLAAELSELTREANRANTTIHTIDPRGLVAGPDLDQTTLDTADWQDHIRETQSSLRVIAELTGGIPVVNSNNFAAALTRIDAETSDYYVLGYYSSNPDPLKKRRTIEIRLKPDSKRRHDKYQLSYKTSYTLKPPAK